MASDDKNIKANSPLENKAPPPDARRLRAHPANGARTTTTCSLIAALRAVASFFAARFGDQFCTDSPGNSALHFCHHRQRP
jgi:hypothetical protein